MRSVSFLTITGMLFVLSACDSAGSSFVVKGKGMISTSGSVLNLGDRSFAETDTVGGASTIEIPVYAFYLSKKEDCTDPVLVQEYATAESINFLASPSPTLFEGNPPEGTYKCMIIEMEDVFTFQPDASSVEASNGVCVENEDYVMDIYRADSGEIEEDDLWVNYEGEEIQPTGTFSSPGSDRVAIFASRNPAAVENGPLSPSTYQVLPLTSDLVVPGQTTFIADSTDKVVVEEDGDGNQTCGLEAIEFGFE